MKKIGLIFGITLVSITALAAVISVFWTRYDPIRAVPTQPLESSSWAHPLGTDGLGIDVLSRLLVGARMCLLTGVFSVLIAGLIGVPLGMIIGSRRNWLSLILLRVIDLIYAFPAVLLAILLAAALGGSTWTAMIAIGISSVPIFARVVRAATMQVMSQNYVQAAKSWGIPRWMIIFRHVLPNIAPLVGVQASVSFGIAILAEAGLSYLGLGSPADTPTWGRMLHDAQVYVFNAPMQAVWPGAAIALAVLGFNLLGDSLRDYLDPTLREVS